MTRRCARLFVQQGRCLDAEPVRPAPYEDSLPAATAEKIRDLRARSSTDGFVVRVRSLPEGGYRIECPTLRISAVSGNPTCDIAVMLAEWTSLVRGGTGMEDQLEAERFVARLDARSTNPEPDKR